MNRLRSWSLRHARGLSTLYRALSAAAPKLTPVVRWLGRERLEHVLLPMERSAKSALFGCRMCGQCALSVTGMACPMGCAKEMRNGPCGGVRADGHCEVRPAQRCTWVDATEGDARIDPDHTPGWIQRSSPLDQRRAGRSTWIEVIAPRPAAGAAARPAVPDADNESASARPSAASGPFEAACREGGFIVTVEIAPPDSPDPAVLRKRAALFDGLVDAINITDGAGANCHMSSVAAASVLASTGLTPVCQVGCRDRNRIALQGDVLGAAALGVRNVLCLTGDDVSQGDHPQAKPVFDLDAVSLLHIARGMCDQGQFASGRKLDRAPDLFIGATVNPFVPPYVDRVANLEKKIVAGARFIQTQFCFDVALFEDFMHEVRRRQLHRRTRIIVGVGTLASAKAFAWMARHVPGVHVPQSLLERIARADDQKLEGQRACIETIAALRQIEGVAGVHVMAYRQEEFVSEIIQASGVLANRRRTLEAGAAS